VYPVSHRLAPSAGACPLSRMPPAGVSLLHRGFPDGGCLRFLFVLFRTAVPHEARPCRFPCLVVRSSPAYNSLYLPCSVPVIAENERLGADEFLRVLTSWMQFQFQQSSPRVSFAVEDVQGERLEFLPNVARHPNRVRRLGLSRLLPCASVVFFPVGRSRGDCALRPALPNQRCVRIHGRTMSVVMGKDSLLPSLTWAGRCSWREGNGTK